MTWHGMCGMRLLQLCLSGKETAGSGDQERKTYGYG